MFIDRSNSNLQQPNHTISSLFNSLSNSNSESEDAIVVVPPYESNLPCFTTSTTLLTSKLYSSSSLEIQSGEALALSPHAQGETNGEFPSPLDDKPITCNCKKSRCLKL